MRPMRASMLRLACSDQQIEVRRMNSVSDVNLGLRAQFLRITAQPTKPQPESETTESQPAAACSILFRLVERCKRLSFLPAAETQQWRFFLWCLRCSLAIMTRLLVCCRGSC